MPDGTAVVVQVPSEAQASGLVTGPCGFLVAPSPYGAGCEVTYVCSLASSDVAVRRAEASLSEWLNTSNTDDEKYKLGVASVPLLLLLCGGGEPARGEGGWGGQGEGRRIMARRGPFTRPHHPAQSQPTCGLGQVLHLAEDNRQGWQAGPRVETKLGGVQDGKGGTVQCLRCSTVLAGHSAEEVQDALSGEGLVKLGLFHEVRKVKKVKYSAVEEGEVRLATWRLEA